jgi:hypothetical protein
MFKLNLNNIKQHTVNALSWKTKRKIVVIQSDDWGSIRMPDRSTYELLLSKNINVKDNYNKYDCIESKIDLLNLFDVLQSFNDCNGNHPVFTANCLMANPDFKKIKEANFGTYFYESIQQKIIDETYIVDLWKKGNSLHIFHPQFHGREHLNTTLWLKALQENHPDTKVAFDNKCWGITTATPSAKRRHYLAAYDFDDDVELDLHKAIIEEGLNLFHDIFGFSSASFIAPNYVWNSALHDTLKSNGVKFIQTQRNQLEPIHHKKYKTIFHYTGQRASNELIFINRNCLFEPSADENVDWVKSCMKDIEQSFLWHTPAVISSHRVNFIGSIFKENRINNTELLSKLLKQIISKWPDVEFMTTVELGDIIKQDIEQ